LNIGHCFSVARLGLLSMRDDETFGKKYKGGDIKRRVFGPRLASKVDDFEEGRDVQEPKGVVAAL